MAIPNELYEEAKCFLCYGMTQAQALKIALLVRQVLQVDADADVSPETLLASASCYNCYAQGNMFDLFELALLDIIASTSRDGLIWGPNPETVVEFLLSGNDPVLNLSNWFSTSYQTISFGNPTHVQTFADFSGSTAVSLEFRLLQTVGGALTISTSANLQFFLIPLLRSVGGSFASQICPLLETHSAPSLVTIGGNVSIFQNVNLETIDWPVWVPTDGTSVDFSQNAISASSINGILARCVAAGLSTANINLAGGANSPPTGQGLIDKATLIANGCTVTTN